MTLYLGLDVSLNHGAGVLLTDSGPPADHWFYTDKKTYARLDGGSFLDKGKEKDDDILAASRLAQVRSWLRWLTTNQVDSDDYVGIEGYAFSMRNQAHQLGEAGGMARLEFIDAEIPFRVHDPSSIKMYVTGRGNAEKDEVVAACREEWSFPPKAMDDTHERRTVEDLADACAVAHMVRTEHHLRTGELLARELPEHRLKVFNRVTKANPVNLLARDWTRIK